MAFSPNLQSQFRQNPLYTQAVAEANLGFQETRGNIGAQQQNLLLQLGNPQLAKQVFLTNWLRSRQKIKGSGGPHGMAGGGGRPGGGYRTRQITPFEHAQLMAIRAGSNPETGTSTFAQIGHQYNLQQEALNNELNSANLFYSGYRGKQLGDLAQQRTTQEAEALRGAQGQLTGMNQQLLQAQQLRRDQILKAAQGAYALIQAQKLGG
jgi:hypothetical protein